MVPAVPVMAEVLPVGAPAVAAKTVAPVTAEMVVLAEAPQVADLKLRHHRAGDRSR
jgi:hypothetical protein